MVAMQEAKDSEASFGPGALELLLQKIGPNTRLVDCVVGQNCRLEQVVARDAEIGDDSVVGPFGMLDPGAQVPSGSRTGPFYTARADE